MDSCIDSRVVQTVNKLLLLGKELKLKFEPNCDRPAMTRLCLLTSTIAREYSTGFLNFFLFTLMSVAAPAA